jgi:Luciferase-like monooxygenase
MKSDISTFVTDEGIATVALARAIEERGFDSLFVAEHTHIPLDRKTPWPRGGELPRRYYWTLDPFITLTAAATKRLLLGAGVALVIERDPTPGSRSMRGARWSRELRNPAHKRTSPHPHGPIPEEGIP